MTGSGGYSAAPIVTSNDVARALLDTATPSNDPVVQFFQLALTGFGYNFYDPKNNARANDSLVREKGSGLLIDAARALGRLERAYRERFIPAPSREHPYPPADETRRAKRVHALEGLCDRIATGLLTAESPGNDAIWSRVRNDYDTLLRLLSADMQIVAAIQGVVPGIVALDTASVAAETALETIERDLARLETLVATRRASLTI